MSYKNLISELNNNNKKIEVSLDWDLGRGIFEDKEYVFDWLDSYVITFDLWIFEDGEVSAGDYYNPKEYNVLKKEMEINDIEVIDRETEKPLILSDDQYEEIRNYLLDLVRYE